MKRLLSFVPFVFAGCASRNTVPSAPPDQPITLGNVTVTPLGSGVYAAIRSEPLGLAVNANSLFIVNSDHVVVVDAQFTRAATQENLAALRRITSKPVRYENAAYREVLPDSTFDRRLTLTAGGRTIDLRWFGRANTRGDAVTWLPKEGIVSAGDLLVAPIPFGFGSYPTEWIAVLDSLKALNPRVIIPGHGPIMRDLGYLNAVQRMLRTARDSAAAAAARGLSADSALAIVRLAALRDEIAGTEKQMRVMFAGFFRFPVVSRAYEEAKGPLK